MTFGKRKTHKFPAKSGAIYTLRRPGPELAISLGRLQRTLKVSPKEFEGKTQEEIGEAVLLKMSERQQIDSALKIVSACIAGPVFVPEENKEYLVVSNPKADNEVSVEDFPTEDFFQILGWHNEGCPDIPVELTGGGETSIAEVNNFPSGQGRSGESGDNSESVSEELCAPVGD